MLCEKIEVEDNIVIFDKDMKPPLTWKDGDLWRMITGANGNVTFIREKISN